MVIFASPADLADPLVRSMTGSGSEEGAGGLGPSLITGASPAGSGDPFDSSITRGPGSSSMASSPSEPDDEEVGEKVRLPEWIAL